jgi:hypothetical protein
MLQPPGYGINQVLQEHRHEVSIALKCNECVIASSIEIAASWDFFLVCAFLYADADNFFTSWDENSLVGKISCEERINKCLLRLQAFFFFLAKKLAKQRVFSQADEKLSSSAKRQARHTEKNSGCFNFCGGCRYNIYRSQLIWRALKTKTAPWLPGLSRDASRGLIGDGN